MALAETRALDDVGSPAACDRSHPTSEDRFPADLQLCSEAAATLRSYVKVGRRVLSIFVASRQRRLRRAGFDDVGFTAGQATEGLPFPDNFFDVVFLAAVIGEVPDQQTCISSLHRALKPGGRLVFAEMLGDPDRISVRQLRDLVEPEGLEFVEARENRWEDLVRFRSIATG